MKILIMFDYDELEKKKFQNMFNFMKDVEVTFGNLSDIKYNDVVFCKRSYINTNDYPLQSFIFGPSFDDMVMPSNKFLQNIGNFNRANSLFIFNCEWQKKAWININHLINMQVFHFPLEVQKYKAIQNINNKDRIFIYHRNRDKQELLYLFRFLARRNYKYIYIDYEKDVKGKEDFDALSIFQSSRYGIVLSEHSNDQFLTQALSCNVPLFVWDVEYANRHETNKSLKVHASSVPHWDDRCGRKVYNNENFQKDFNNFIMDLTQFKPREYIMENFTNIKCSEKFKKLIMTMEENMMDMISNV